MTLYLFLPNAATNQQATTFVEYTVVMLYARGTRMKVCSDALGTELGPNTAERISRRRLRLWAIVTLLVLLFCSLSFSYVSLVGSTVGETWRKHIIRAHPMKANLFGRSRLLWIDSKPEALSEPGHTEIVLEYGHSVSGGILFARIEQSGYQLWVEHSDYETSIMHTIKDEDVLRQAAQILKQRRKLSLPSGIEKGPVVVKSLSWVGIVAELTVLASLLVIIYTTAREWMDGRRETKPGVNGESTA
jgi:hypothetical protein